MKLKATMLATATCALAALAAGGAIADGARPAASTASSAVSDLKVARDKATGRLRAPTAEENAELAASARSIAPNVVVVSRPVTTVEVRADGSAVAKRSLEDMDNLVLTRSADGKAVLRHTSEPAAQPAPAQNLPQE